MQPQVVWDINPNRCVLYRNDEDWCWAMSILWWDPLHEKRNSKVSWIATGQQLSCHLCEDAIVRDKHVVSFRDFYWSNSNQQCAFAKKPQALVARWKFVPRHFSFATFWKESHTRSYIYYDETRRFFRLVTHRFYALLNTVLALFLTKYWVVWNYWQSRRGRWLVSKHTGKFSFQPIRRNPQISQGARPSPVNVLPLRLWKSIANAWNTRYAGVLPFWSDTMPDIIPWFHFIRVFFYSDEMCGCGRDPWELMPWRFSTEKHLSGHC